ncbi:hypothetical protein BWI93_07745 [Siphonobacter sp. BAB-5385]|uniref:hypothetical protein n=1 Tax=unclassified Siphonobacter TaxID=2635712 RepID=UPI000B9E1256|nr:MULTISPECIES: hypothetical protein [unclassified Siphonobacter]OZI08738.1 hypothetical protein BWI93_07745 [Siphonobacter sp. BAB-5385]PMD99204.1 hypothetical protein BWI97_02000 [Siphonobacter sp. BAB-5405]
MEDLASHYAHIKGWGIDADPKNEPTYPMKNYTGDDHRRLNYEKPPQQPVNVEVLHSNERPGITAVFGTSSPPSGLSGAIRRYAFKFSESEYGHWLPLLFADRVNVVEGIIDDLKRGHIPNILAEKGWNAEWKYNRKGLITKLAVGALVTATAVALLCRSNSNEDED